MKWLAKVRYGSNPVFRVFPLHVRSGIASGNPSGKISWIRPQPLASDDPGHCAPFVAAALRLGLSRTTRAPCMNSVRR